MLSFITGRRFPVEDADTAGLMLDYFVNDNVSLELVLGAPPEMELSGHGTIDLPVVGNKGDLSSLIKLRQPMRIPLLCWQIIISDHINKQVPSLCWGWCDVCTF